MISAGLVIALGIGGPCGVANVLASVVELGNYQTAPIILGDTCDKIGLMGPAEGAQINHVSANDSSWLLGSGNVDGAVLNHFAWHDGNGARAFNRKQLLSVKMNRKRSVADSDNLGRGSTDVPEPQIKFDTTPGGSALPKLSFDPRTLNSNELVSRSGSHPQSVAGKLDAPQQGSGSKYPEHKRRHRPPCRVSSGVCGLPLSAKIGLAVILALIAGPLILRGFDRFDGLGRARRNRSGSALYFGAAGSLFGLTLWLWSLGSG